MQQLPVFFGFFKIPFRLFPNRFPILQEKAPVPVNQRAVHHGGVNAVAVHVKHQVRQQTLFVISQRMVSVQNGKVRFLSCADASNPTIHPEGARALNGGHVKQLAVVQTIRPVGDPVHKGGDLHFRKQIQAVVAEHAVGAKPYGNAAANHFF